MRSLGEAHIQYGWCLYKMIWTQIGTEGRPLEETGRKRPPISYREWHRAALPAPESGWHGHLGCSRALSSSSAHMEGAAVLCCAQGQPHWTGYGGCPPEVQAVVRGGHANNCNSGDRHYRGEHCHFREGSERLHFQDRTSDKRQGPWKSPGMSRNHSGTQGKEFANRWNAGPKDRDTWKGQMRRCRAGKPREWLDMSRAEVSSRRALGSKEKDAQFTASKVITMNLPYDFICLSWQHWPQIYFYDF